MNIDRRAREAWDAVGPVRRAGFFGCFVTGLLVHLYAFTNLIPNSDGLSRVFDTQQMTVSGRWFLHYASALNAFTQMPMAIGLLSLLLLGTAAALAADVLRLNSRVLAGLAGAAMAAFPCLGYTFLYMFTASAYCLAILLAVLSVWLARRGKLRWVLGVAALALSMGTYQAYAAVAVALSLLAVLRECLDPRASLRGTLALGARLAGFLAAGAAVYFIVLLVFLRVKDLELLSYLGMDQASAGYPIGRLPRTVLDTYKQVIALFFLPGRAGSFADILMVLGDALALLLGGWAFFSAMRALGAGRESWRLAAGLLLLALLPLAAGFAQVISPWSEATPIMKYACVCVYLAALMLLDAREGLPAPAEKRREVRSAGALICAAALALSFVNANNLMYTASAQAHRATESYLTRLMARVEDCPGYEPGMEVAFIGAIPDSQVRSTVESYARMAHYSVPQSTVATLNKHIYYYLSDWLNVPLSEPGEDTLKAVAASPEFLEMPLYPAPGSVRVLDGRVVVRLRETYTPKSDYELAYENRK